MKILLLIIGGLSLLATVWLLCALALARIRGWQVRRLLREMEGREFPPPKPRNHCASKKRLVVAWKD